MLPKDKLEILRSLTREETILYWEELEGLAEKEKQLPQMIRLLCLSDLYYLLVRICGRTDMLNDFSPYFSEKISSMTLTF